MVNKFTNDYLRNIVNGGEPQVIDREQAGKHTEFLESVKLVYEQGGHDAAIEAMRECAPTDINIHALFAPPRWHLYSLDELRNLPKLSYIVEGIIPEKGLVMMYGPSGVGKTFMTSNQALRLSKTYPIVYLAAEGQSGYMNRIDAWLSYHNVSRDDLNFHLIFEIVNLYDKSEVLEFAALMNERGISPSVLYIDTLSRCIPGAKENESSDMSRIIENCDYLRHTLDTAVVLVHHSGKGSNSSTERGSSALRAAVDISIKFQNENGVVTVSCDKSKDSEPFKDRYYELQPHAESCVSVSAGRKVEIDGANLRPNQWKLLEALSLSHFEKSGRNQEIMEASGVSGGTFYSSMSALKDAGYVRQSKNRAPYFITEKGLEILQERDRQLANQGDF